MRGHILKEPKREGNRCELSVLKCASEYGWSLDRWGPRMGLRHAQLREEQPERFRAAVVAWGELAAESLAARKGGARPT